MAGARCAGGRGRPQGRRGRCNAAGDWGFRPRGGEAGAQASPYLSGWADRSRAPLPGVPDRKITAKGGPGKRRVASGQGRRIKFHGQEDTPIPPWFVWKAAGAKVGGGLYSPSPPGWQAAEVNTFAWHTGDFCDTRRGRQ